MATQREYLVGLGLAKEGRGRFSAEAKAALDKAIAGGMTFDDPKPATPAKRVVVSTNVKSSSTVTVKRPKADKPVVVIAATPKVRESRTLYAVADNGVRVGYDTCFGCTRHMSRCTCKGGPKPPAGAVAVATYREAMV